MKFDEFEIQRLFGHEAAEDEDPKRLREYYFKSKAYNQVVNDLPLRILVGHKGIGKSALFQVAIAEESEINRLTLLIKPDDIVGIGEESDNFLKLIRDWKTGINEIIAKKALISFGLLQDGWKKKLHQYGGTALDFLAATLGSEKTVQLAPTKQAVLANFLKNNKISVYIDDLDRGWQGRKQDIQRISALLNAVRDISTENRGIYFRVGLRTDVYYLARTSDESTDKIENSVIWFSWTNHEILVLLVKRIESYFGNEINEEELLRKHQSGLMDYLKPLIEERFTGKGHWENAPMYRVLMSLIRKRPRDLVKILTLAARQARAKNSKLICTQHLNAIFEEYSQGRLQDTINEYRSELPNIEKLILGMRPSRIQRRASEGYVYTTDKLLKKIRSIEEQGGYRASDGKPYNTKELAAFLYKINFITARKETDSGIDRKYFEENRYLSNKFTEFGYDWEVHPAYRWALQPEEPLKIFQELELSLA
ncbi:P-loop ATPase, Sll1717 family [Shewanella atlantica]|uniref:P-loop ATPase, Sll1717 family n=1 Tax=Shewanella atlantica TaxID=271099 RepID=UPI00373531FE